MGTGQAMDSDTDTDTDTSADTDGHNDITAAYFTVDKPIHKKSDGRLPIIEVFGPTIQGEGQMYGQKTTFIRFGGCDFRCKMCDSMHAVEPSAVKKNATWSRPEDICEAVQALGDAHDIPWITLSGGNPCIWEDIGAVVSILSLNGYKIALETQGTIWQEWIYLCDQVTISPKGPGMGETFNQEVFSRFLRNAYGISNEENIAVKIVVFDQRDFEFAVEVDQILTSLAFRGKRFLSLGNPWPPTLQPNGTLDQGVIPSEDVTFESGGQIKRLPTMLLDQYRSLLDDYLQDPRLSQWRFLPQLHVLVWGNEICR